MKPLVSVHVVHYSCSNCGEETQEVKMCNECSAPMRVIQVAELYGDEANEYLENLKQEETKESKDKSVGGVQFDDSVSGVEQEELDSESVEPEEEDDVELAEIFPEEEDDNSRRTYVGDLGDDFETALEELDKEDDDLGDDVEDLPEL